MGSVLPRSAHHPADLRFGLRLQHAHDLATGAVVAAEAWPAWYRAGRPFPAAAIRDRIMAIHALLRTAAEHARGAHAMPVSVNADAAALADGSFAEAAAAALAATSCPPARLAIEIPEPLLDTVDLAPLHAMGLGVVADHYGTGAMSLRLLGSLRLAAIKLDASLVRDIPRNRPRQGLARALVTAAASRRITVAACGIEAEEERAALASLGVRTAQAPLFAAPHTIAA